MIALPVLLFILACSGEAGSQSTPAPPTPVSEAETRKARLENQLLPRFSEASAELLSGRAWLEEVSAAELGMVEAMLEAELSARRRGEEESIPEILRFAEEQPWFADGVNDSEVLGLTGIFLAYNESLADVNAPPIGPVLSATIEGKLFTHLELPQSGEIILLTTAETRGLAEDALELAAWALPQVEAFTGAFPYRFLFIEVSSDIPEIYAGLSYDEFIVLSPAYVDAATVVHEIAHSAMYGIFPMWFEEGLAHFLELYVTESLEQGVATYREELDAVGKDPRLDLSIFRLATFEDVLAERAQGLLFLNGLYEIEGIDGLSHIVQTLRTQTHGDHSLLRELVSSGSESNRARLNRFVCEGVIGVRSGC